MGSISLFDALQSGEITTETLHDHSHQEFFMVDVRHAAKAVAKLSELDEGTMLDSLSQAVLCENREIHGAIRYRDQSDVQLEVDIGVEQLAMSVVDILSLYVGVIHGNGYFEPKSEISVTWGSSLVSYLVVSYALGGKIVSSDELLRTSGLSPISKSFYENMLLANMVHQFVLGHELGHVASLLGSPVVNRRREMFRKIVAGIDFRESPGDVDVDQWTEEFCADVVGFKAGVEEARRRGAHPIYAYCGAQLFMAIVKSVAATRREHGLIHATHPITQSRMDVLEWMTQNLPEEVPSTGKKLTEAVKYSTQPLCGLCGLAVTASFAQTPLLIDDPARFISPCTVCDMWVCWRCAKLGLVDIAARVGSEELSALLRRLERSRVECRIPSCPSCSAELGITDLDDIYVLNQDGVAA